MSERCFVIAEAGVNHNGDLDLARRLIDAAKEAGADAVKFQTWLPGEQSGTFASAPEYQSSSIGRGGVYEMLETLRLTLDDFRELACYARQRSIIFLSTPDGPDSADYLIKEIGLSMIKIGSTEVTNIHFLRHVAAYGCEVILSTGMSTLGEVEKAVNSLMDGGSGPITLLHCTSEYPAPPEDMNVRAMVTMRHAFHLPVGLSDHSTGFVAPVMAVSLGAALIEKHMTLDRSLPGPDHAASLEPKSFKRMIDYVREAEIMLGDGIKRVAACELANLELLRRGVVAAHNIKRGTRLHSSDLTCKRPGVGIAPEHLDCLVGRRVKRDLRADEPIGWEDVL